MKSIITTCTLLLVALFFTACSPEPGTEAWCNKIKEKPKGDWSANDAGTFTEHCLMGNYKE
jgi:hypothetical protein